VIGEIPEWTLWLLVGLLVFVMLLSALKPAEYGASGREP
jgi:hypothetical protein